MLLMIPADSSHLICITWSSNLTNDSSAAVLYLINLEERRSSHLFPIQIHEEIRGKAGIRLIDPVSQNTFI